MTDKIYDRLWPIIRSKHASIEKASQVGQKYKDYIVDQYKGSLKLTHGKDSNFIAKYIDSIVRDEKEKIEGLSSTELEEMLELDEAYDRLVSLSFEVLEQAKKKKNNSLSCDSIENYDAVRNNIIAIYDSIKQKNKEEASDILSETLVEVNYIYGISNNESMRLSHEMTDALNNVEFEMFEQTNTTKQGV